MFNIKKLLASVSVAAILSSSFLINASAATYHFRGDVNNDAYVDAKDANALTDFILGKKVSGITRQSSDLNNDGTVNIFDLVLLRRILAGYDKQSIFIHDDGGREIKPGERFLENDKYYVTLIDRDGDLKFSEPDTPDVIHDVKNTYDVSFVIYTDDPKRKSRFIQIDNKEITAYTCAEKICIKDMGDFTADSKTYKYMDYDIDENIIDGDIVSGALSVDPDTNYVEFGDLYVVKPALGNGDANCDGTVDMSDVVLVMQSLSNPNRYGLKGTEDTRISGRGLRLADLNGEGVTVQDAQLIQEKLLGLE